MSVQHYIHRQSVIVSLTGVYFGFFGESENLDRETISILTTESDIFKRSITLHQTRCISIISIR